MNIPTGDKLVRSEEYTGPDRRREVQLNDDQIEAIAEKAAERAVQKLTDSAYKAIGKSVIEKLFYIVGVCSVALYLWLQTKDRI